MNTFVKNNWFFIGIIVVIAIAFAFPAAGIFVREYGCLKIGIFLVFVTTGLTLETADILDQLKNIKVMIAALLSSLVLFPATAYLLAKICFSSNPDFVIGVLLIAAAPATVASGTVMTAIARGNVSLSLFICVLCNFAAIVTMPFTLSLFLSIGDSIQLPAGKMFLSLVVIVLIPTVLGQLLRPKLEKTIEPYLKEFSIFAQLVVLLIIFNAVSSSTTKLVQAGYAVIFLFAFMASLHVLFLIINKYISRLIKLPLPSEIAFAIHTSQKTLSVTYLVWAGYFAVDYPMALIPPIAYHLSQMILGTTVAQRYRKKTIATHCTTS